jgi:EmrB/QacA subfamily drug resistance transporter
MTSHAERKFDPASPPSTENMSVEQQPEPRPEPDTEPEPFKATWRIWVIFIIIMILSLISAVDATIITTSLPTIARDIGGSNQYVWVAQSYLFASTIPQPFYGQIANIFGRRNPLFVAIALFALGSGIAGGAKDVTTLIAGRVVQGFGTGGVAVLPEIIICDLIPPLYRGPWLSITMSAAAIGTTLGPIIGGALAESDWRWIFWLNLPVSGVSAVAIFFVLNVQYKRSPTWKSALARIDFSGNAIFIPAMVSLYFGLIMGGTKGYPWSSWRIILPLVLGVVGWAAFHVHQASRFCVEPSMPPRLFKNRTSAVGFTLIFLAAILLQGISYFLPVYFQAVKGTSALQSGVNYLPFALAIIPFGGTAGFILSKTSQYKPLHWAGFALSAVATGLFSTLDKDSSKGAWIGYQVIASGGAGLIFTATLPSTLAALPEADVATATGTYSFVRAIGLVWGVTISSIVFNGQINSNLHLVDDVDVHKLLGDGAAYTFAAGSEDGSTTVGSLPEPSRSQVVAVYEKALSVVWLVFVGISCLGFLATFIEKSITLRGNHTSEFGLEKEKERSHSSRTEEGLVAGEEKVAAAQ